MASTSSAAIGSSALVGSSSNSTLGLRTSAAPIATLCCSPPLNVEIERSRNSVKLNKSRTSSTRLRITSGAMPWASKPNAISSSTLSATNPLAGF